MSTPCWDCPIEGTVIRGGVRAGLTRGGNPMVKGVESTEEEIAVVTHKSVKEAYHVEVDIERVYLVLGITFYRCCGASLCRGASIGASQG